MVTIHVGFLLCICILFLLLGVVISVYIKYYFDFLLSKKDLESPVIIEVINKVYHEDNGNIIETVDTCNHNYNIPINLKDKSRHRVSNTIKAPAKKIP